jgi:hypothetical protein
MDSSHSKFMVGLLQKYTLGVITVTVALAKDTAKTFGNDKPED